MTNTQATDRNWTYSDVMALVVALTERTKFSCNQEDWQLAWYAISQMPEAQELLSGVHFELREPHAPFSSQVELLISSLSESGFLSTSHNRLSPWAIEAEDKAKIIVDNLDLYREHIEFIRRMAKCLNEKLAP